MNEILRKDVVAHGAIIPMLSFDDGKTWMRQSYESIATTLQFPPLPCVTATASGRPQSPVRSKSVVVARKKWGPHSLGRKAEGISLRSKWAKLDAARRMLLAAQQSDCELTYIREVWQNPAAKDPNKSAGFALMGKMLIPQSLPAINIKD